MWVISFLSWVESELQLISDDRQQEKMSGASVTTAGRTSSAVFVTSVNIPEDVM